MAESNVSVDMELPKEDSLSNRNPGPIIAFSLLGIIIAAFIFFLLYIFVGRDKWEIENYSKIMGKCDAVFVAIETSQDGKTEKAYEELINFIGVHTITNDFLVKRLGETQKAFIPIKDRIEQARSELISRERQRSDLAQETQKNAISFSYSEKNRSGSVNYSLVNTFKKSWQKEGFRYKSADEQAQGLAVFILVVYTDCPNPKDREATLDYIERHIESW